MNSIFEQFQPESHGGWIKNKQLDVSKFEGMPTYLGTLNKINSKNEKKTIYVTLRNDLIYYQSKQQGPVEGYLNLKFKRLESIQQDNNYGFRIYSRNNVIELWAESEDENLDCEREVGKGNFAKVYMGRDKETDEIVAIKTINKTMLAENSRNVQALINEIECMRGIRHPYIIALYGVFEDENYVHLIMEYCGCGELFRRILKRGKFQENVAAKLMYNALEALVHLHEIHKVVHRDLKPENLLMTDKELDYEFKIADFGLASKCYEENLTLRCGSPGYVATEILKNKPYGFKSDIFSMGIILYILLSGRSPFSGKKPQEILYQNRECRIYFQERYWSQISRKAMDLIIRMTEPDPLLRCSARQCLAHPWFKEQNLGPSQFVENILQEPKKPLKEKGEQQAPQKQNESDYESAASEDYFSPSEEGNNEGEFKFTDNEEGGLKKNIINLNVATIKKQPGF